MSQPIKSGYGIPSQSGMKKSGLTYADHCRSAKIGPALTKHANSANKPKRYKLRHDMIGYFVIFFFLLYQFLQRCKKWATRRAETTYPNCAPSSTVSIIGLKF
jgi:hypothetical protein